MDSYSGGKVLRNHIFDLGLMEKNFSKLNSKRRFSWKLVNNLNKHFTECQNVEKSIHYYYPLVKYRFKTQ